MVFRLRVYLFGEFSLEVVNVLSELKMTLLLLQDLLRLRRIRPAGRLLGPRLKSNRNVLTIQAQVLLPLVSVNARGQIQ